jgi:hypothetical protein
MLGPQLVALFREIVETLGSGVWLEEEGHCGYAFEGYAGSPVFHPPNTLLPVYHEVKKVLHHPFLPP